MRTFTHWRSIALRLASIPLLGILVACNDGVENVSPPTIGEADDEERKEPLLSSSQVLGLMQRADEGAIQQANVAVTRAEDPLVKAFALRILAERQHIAELATLVLPEIEISPTPSEAAETLTQEAAIHVQDLDHIAVESFDMKFLEVQVASHTKALAFIDDSEPCVMSAGVGGPGAFAGYTFNGCRGISEYDFATGAPAASSSANASDLVRLRDLVIVTRSAMVSHLTEAVWLRSKMMSAVETTEP